MAKANKFRALALIIKSVLHQIHSSNTLIRPKKTRDFSEFENYIIKAKKKDYKPLYLLIIYSLLCLTKMERTKKSLENILLRSESKFKQTLNKLQIERRELDFSQLETLQSMVRQEITTQYVENKDKYWRVYQNQQKRQKESVEAVFPGVNNLLSTFRLKWDIEETEENKKKRISNKRTKKDHQNTNNSCLYSMEFRQTEPEIRQSLKENESALMNDCINGQFCQGQLEPDHLFLYTQKVQKCNFQKIKEIALLDLLCEQQPQKLNKWWGSTYPWDQ